MDGGVSDDAVALADRVVEAGQAFAARCGLDPEAELADLNGFGVEVHAVEVVLEDLAVEVKEGALAAQLFEPGVGGFIDGVELVEGLDEESAAAAGGVEDAEAFEFLLPGLPESDEGFALRGVDGVQVVGVGVGQGFAGGADGFGLVLLAEGFKALFDDAAQGLPDDVAGDESGGVEGAFLFAAGFGLVVIGGDAALGDGLAEAFEVGDGLLEDVAEDVHVDDGTNLGGFVLVGDFAGGAVVEIAEILEMGANLVGHVEVVEGRVGGEEAAVVGGGC